MQSVLKDIKDIICIPQFCICLSLCILRLKTVIELKNNKQIYKKQSLKIKKSGSSFGRPAV